MRLEETGTVKEYLRILGGNKPKSGTPAMLNVYRDMDWLGNNIGMVKTESACLQEKAVSMPEGAVKGHVVHAADRAADGVSDAVARFWRAYALFMKGAEDAIAGFQRGKGNAMEKPFSITAVEAELAAMMKSLESAYEAVDRGIGRAEAAGGLRCVDGRYRGRAGTPELEALAGALWPLRSLGKLIGQAHDAAYRAACRADTMRPKGRRIMKKAVLAEGIFRDAGGEPQKAVGFLPGQEKPSILERLMPAGPAKAAESAEPAKVAEPAICHAGRSRQGRGGEQR